MTTTTEQVPIGTPITQRQATQAVLRMLRTPIIGDIEKDSGPGHTLNRILSDKGCYSMLSTGERRLVDIAWALWKEPADEGARITVLGGLDPTLRRKVLIVLLYRYLGRDLRFSEVTADENEFAAMFGPVTAEGVAG